MVQQKGDIQKLPRVVGVMADYHYTKQEYVSSLVLQVRPNTVITTTTGGGMEEILERISILRGDLYFKAFTSDPWEEAFKGKKHAAKLRDFLFVNYLKFNKGFLFLFPAKYDTRTIGLQYSKRMQDIIILAHQLQVPYDIILAETKEEGNDNT